MGGPELDLAERPEAPPAPQATPTPASAAGEPSAWEPPFGPTFFLEYLSRFVCEHCPPTDAMPTSVDLHLSDGDALHLIRIVGVTPSWVVLSVDDRDVSGGTASRVEFVPYGHLKRVTVRRLAAPDGRIGFSPDVRPGSLSP
jgi:hypothetical protein